MKRIGLWNIDLISEGLKRERSTSFGETVTDTPRTGKSRFKYQYRYR
ncbi:hypothetical protein VCR14J2_390005 [Vibrio coralliirubri]|nr:hypothetical protein VCR14J2_390005 [Vibrio coralliirubri]